MTRYGFGRMRSCEQSVCSSGVSRCSAGLFARLSGAAAGGADQRDARVNKGNRNDVRILRAGGPVPETPEESLGVASRSWSPSPRRGSGPEEARLGPWRRSGKKSRALYEFLTAFCVDGDQRVVETHSRQRKGVREAEQLLTRFWKSASYFSMSAGVRKPSWRYSCSSLIRLRRMCSSAQWGEVSHMLMSHGSGRVMGLGTETGTRRTEDVCLELLEVFRGLQACKGPQSMEDVLLLFRSLLIGGLHLRSYALREGCGLRMRRCHLPPCSSEALGRT